MEWPCKACGQKIKINAKKCKWCSKYYFQSLSNIHNVGNLLLKNKLEYCYKTYSMHFYTLKVMLVTQK